MGLSQRSAGAGAESGSGKYSFVFVEEGGENGTCRSLMHDQKGITCRVGFKQNQRGQVAWDCLNSLPSQGFAKTPDQSDLP